MVGICLNGASWESVRCHWRGSGERGRGHVLVLVCAEFSLRGREGGHLGRWLRFLRVPSWMGRRRRTMLEM